MNSTTYDNDEPICTDNTTEYCVGSQHNQQVTPPSYNYPKMSTAYYSYGVESSDDTKFIGKADPSWSIERKIAWLKRRDYLRTHRDVYIPDDRPGDKAYHKWWHTKGKFQSMKHYVDGEQPYY